MKAVAGVTAIKKRKKTYEERIVDALRETWRKYSPERKAALAQQKIKGVANAYICAHCETMTLKPQVDHIERIGPRPGSRNAKEETDWNLYISRMNSHRLQVLCGCCHRLKTKQEAK